MQQIAEHSAIRFRFHFGAESGGKLAGKFGVAARVPDGCMAHDCSAFFLGGFQRGLGIA